KREGRQGLRGVPELAAERGPPSGIAQGRDLRCLRSGGRPRPGDAACRPTVFSTRKGVRAQMSVTITDKAAFKGRVRAWAVKLGAQVTSITVRPMTTKWASYSTTGRLTFDAFLLELPEELQDYVIAHELLHFHAPNHGKLWKSLMRAHLGDYEQWENEL